MGALTGSRLKMIAELLRSLPLSALCQLDAGLNLSQDPHLGEVRRIVVQEIESHFAKSQVFLPFVPLFQPREDGMDGVLFPEWVLNRLWRALERIEPQLFAEGLSAAHGLSSGDPTPEVFFRLVSAAAEIAHLRPEAVLPPGAAKEDAAALEAFAEYLDLHRLLRDTLLRLPEWMGRIDAEKAVAIRLAFKDASVRSEAGGVRFLEALYANLSDPNLVMKFVATVSDGANDKFLSESELAVFGERLLGAAEQRAKVFEALMRRRDKGGASLTEAGGWVIQCFGLIQILQQSVEMTRDGPWGRRVGHIRQTISSLIEDRLKTVEKVIAQALPRRSERIFGRATRELPDYEGPRPEQAELAAQIVTFLNQIRPAANQGGYASLLNKTVLAAEKEMDAYFETVLAVAIGDEPFDPGAVMVCFERVIALMEGLLGEEKGNLARRRVASADIYRAPKTIA